MCMLISAYVPLADLPAFAAQLRAHIRAIPADQRVVVDIESWRTSPRIDADAMSAEIAALLTQADFGHPLHRLDITVTSERADADHAAEHLRTQHFTYTRSEAGFTEVPLYRNLHPMLAERLNLWRLSNFKLQRLPSAEDVYLYHAVAHENPKDERLIALAEVRDLTPARSVSGKLIGFPHLEGQLAQALADIRHALAGRPQKQRPLSNRVVLYVRPTWNIPTGTWRKLAHKLAPMAAGLGLEKVSVRIRTEDAATGEIRDAVLDIENVADRAVTVRVRPPVDQPIRPLTEYKQKVLRAQRIGAPYPYELIRMLTPPVGAEADFPSGDVHRVRPRRDRRAARAGRPAVRPQQGRDRRRGDQQPHRTGARGHAPGGHRRRPDAGPWQPHREGVPANPRCARSREPACGSPSNGSRCRLVPASPGTAARRTWTGSPPCCAA